MMVAGIVLLICGGVSLLYGLIQNSSLQAQLMSALGSGTLNPGTPFMVVGAIAAAVGIVLMVLASRKKKAASGPLPPTSTQQ